MNEKIEDVKKEIEEVKEKNREIELWEIEL